MRGRVKPVGSAMAIVALLISSSTAMPQAPARSTLSYPTKPVRVVVSSPAGGSPDILARMVAQCLSESFGQQVVIDNRAGAGGIIGVEIVARAAADGYTLLVGHLGTFAVNVTLYPSLPYDPIKDFQPITLFAKVP